MDFIDKYKLGLEWDEYTQTELSIVDKKAQIRAPLKIVTVPPDLQRAARLEPVQAEISANPEQSLQAWQVQFEVSCMKKLDSHENQSTKADTEAATLNHGVW